MSYHQLKSPIGLCFLGCGNITQKHVKHAKKCPEKIQISFASRTQEKASAYQKKYNGAHAYSSYDAAIESATEQVIMINTPPNAHFDLTKKALDAGKHVIVEKPPFFKASDFDILGNLAEEKGLQLMVAENYYYKPLRSTLENLLKEQVIGDPLFMIINATKTQASKNDWRDDPKLTGFGALFEGGIHWINFINNLGLTITNINGFLPKQKEYLEKSMQVVAKTKEGVVINLLYSWEVDTIAKGLRLSRIFGRKGSITFETNGVFVWVRGKKKRLKFPSLPNITGSQSMFNDFMNALKHGTAPAFNWRMAQSDLALVEAVYKDVKIENQKILN